MPIEEEWGIRVLRARTKLGLTQWDFAQKLGISQAVVAKWEKMKPRPYSAQAEWFMRVEEQIDKLTDTEAERWLGPDEYNESGGL